MQQIRYEGYWNTHDNRYPEYPIPLPNVLTASESIEIARLIELKELESEVMSYRGISMSRVDGSVVGSREFDHPSGWRWPDGFREHYVLKHKVKPANDFLTFIGYKI